MFCHLNAHILEAISVRDPNPICPVWTQVDVLLGDPTKALTVLGWNPTKTPFVKVRR